MRKTTLPKAAQARPHRRITRRGDLDLVVRYAACVGDGAYFLSRDAAARQIRRRKHEIQALERLNGTAIVTDGEVVQTVYRPSKRRMRKFLRGPRRRWTESQGAR